MCSGMIERFRLKKQLKIVTNASAAKDQELNSLRNLPITAEEGEPEESTETQVP